MGWHVLVGGVVLILHGLVHPAVFGPPTAADSPWDAHRSWLFAGLSDGDRRVLAIVLAVITAAVYLFAGIGLLGGADWWAPAAIIASVTSLLLLVSYFHPWLSLGVVLDLAIIWAAVAGWPR